MAFVLTMKATGTCSHAADAKPVAGNPRVKIDGSPVLTVATQFTVSGCPNLAGTSPFPCAVAMFPAGAARVKVMGVPVLLDTSTATVLPTGVTLKLTNPQQRVKGQ
jgi:hypothetical protein